MPSSRIALIGRAISPPHRRAACWPKKPAPPRTSPAPAGRRPPEARRRHGHHFRARPAQARDRRRHGHHRLQSRIAGRGRPRLAELTRRQACALRAGRKKLARLAQAFPQAAISSAPCQHARRHRRGHDVWCAQAPLAPGAAPPSRNLLGALGQFLELARSTWTRSPRWWAARPPSSSNLSPRCATARGRRPAARQGAEARLESVLGSAKLLAQSGAEPRRCATRSSRPTAPPSPACRSCARSFRETLKETILAAPAARGTLQD